MTELDRDISSGAYGLYRLGCLPDPDLWCDTHFADLNLYADEGTRCVISHSVNWVSEYLLGRSYQFRAGWWHV